MRRLVSAFGGFLTISLLAPSATAAPVITVTPNGSSAITVAWSGTVDYRLEVKVGGVSGTTIQVAEANAAGPVTFNGLTAGTSYTVVMTDKADSSTTSATAAPVADRPSAPVNLALSSICELTIKATWEDPVDVGSLGVSGYKVKAYVGESLVEELDLPLANSHTFAPVSSPTSYVEVQVAAIDSIGVSPNFTSQQLQAGSTEVCESSAAEDSGDSGGSGGGGGIAPITDGEALPGVPKSLAGSDRVATSIAVAEADFLPATTNPTAQSATLRAKAAVIASSTSFPDALSAGPLAYSKVAPLLLTGKNSLDSRVSSTLTKLVPAGSTVYIVGGEAAVSANVATAISNLGFTVQRIAGLDRYDTSVKVAQALGNPTKAFAATGLDFPDALSAGVIAARQSGSILLTRGGEIPLAVAGYLLENPGTVVTAVGGPAATAFPAATSYRGADRYATAVSLAEAFPPSSVTAGVASGRNFPDGLVAAPYLARRGGVLVLTQQLVVPSATSGYIKATTKIDVLQVFGGLSVVSDAARRTLATYL